MVISISLTKETETFHTCQTVNCYNCRTWSSKQSNVIIECLQNAPKENGRLGFPKTNRLYGPFMFAENTRDISRYFSTVPRSAITGWWDFWFVLFQQDDVPLHLALTVYDYLNDIYPDRWTGRRSTCLWQSPDHTVLDFFAWVFIQDFAYKYKVSNVTVPKNCIR